MNADLRRYIFQDTWFLTGSILSIIFAFTVLAGPPLVPFDPWDMSFTPISPPSSEHFLGINDGGQDIFSELIFAIRNTVIFGLVSGLVALGIGVIIGLVAGWLGGFIDMILMRLADVLLAIPAIMILILTAALFRPSPFVLSLILAGLMWPTISKAIRAQTLTLRESLHVKAAAQIGGSNCYIIRRHLMPRNVSSVSHRPCCENQDGHVHGSISGFPWTFRSQPEIARHDDRLCC